MKKGAKIGIGIGSVLLVSVGAFFLYRRNKIKNRKEKLQAEGYSFQGCVDGMMDGTKYEDGVEKGVTIPCGLFTF